MSEKPWYLHHHGVELIIDSPRFPVYTGVVACDVETDEQDNLHCLSVCGADRKVYVWFNPPQFVFDGLKNSKLVFHSAKGDIGWLEKYGIGMESVVGDTMLGAYVLASTRESLALKDLAKEDLGLVWPSYKEMTTSKEFIEEACTERPELRIVKGKKTRNPKKLVLPQMPRELVANYNGMDAYATFLLHRVQQGLMDNTAKAYYQKIEIPTMKALFDVEKRGIKVDLQRLLEVHKGFLREARGFRKQFVALVGGDVLISSPAQVKPALIRLGLNIEDTNENTLIPYQDHPAVTALLGYRRAIKICGTYTKPLFKRGINSPGQRIHCSFTQSTDTGRLACRNPNLQNQPPELRDCFIAEEGSVFVNADYSQIELRIPAHFSGEPLMVDTFVHAKEKMHQVTADAVGRPYKVGKTINFLLTNSGGSGRLAQIAGITEEEAEKTLETFWERFGVLRTWMDQEKAMAVKLGGVRTILGRWIPIPDLKSPNFGIRKAAERSAISGKVQGSAADLMKLALIRLHRKGVPMVITVHDEVMAEVCIEKAEMYTDLIRFEMENALKLKVPVLADVGVGKNWKEAKE